MTHTDRVERHDEHYRVGLFSDGDYARAFDAAEFAHREPPQDMPTGRGTWVAGRAALSG